MTTSTLCSWNKRLSPRPQRVAPRLKCSALLAAVAMSVLLVVLPVVSANGGGRPDPTQQPSYYGYFDFPTCVRYALVHSDQLLDSRIEVQLKSINLKDAHAELLPTIEMASRYYLTRTSETAGNRFNVSFYMRNWNPYLALFKIKGYNVLMDIATITHDRKISEGIAKLAKLFYRIHLLEKRIRLHRQKLALEQEKVNYGKSRLEQGAIDDVLYRTWHNQLRTDRISLKNLENQLEQEVAELKSLIGYHPDYYLPLDTRDAVSQILAGFNGQMIAFSDIQGANLTLKTLAKKEQLESVQLAGAYFQLLPQPMLLFESLSNQPDRTSGSNIAIGVDYTMWDGFRRVRDIKRRKFLARRAEIDRKEMSETLYRNYKKLMSVLDLSSERETVAHERVKLAEMNEERVLLNYRSGDVPFEQYVGSRVTKVESDINAVGILEPRVMALIDLATLAGGLDKYNARIAH